MRIRNGRSDLDLPSVKYAARGFANIPFPDRIKRNRGMLFQTNHIVDVTVICCVRIRIGLIVRNLNIGQFPTFVTRNVFEFIQKRVDQNSIERYIVSCRKAIIRSFKYGIDPQRRIVVAILKSRKYLYVGRGIFIHNQFVLWDE